MNKMNLPPPFEEDAIPGRFTAKQKEPRQNNGDVSYMHRERIKRYKADETSKAQIAEEEEEEEESGADGPDAGVKEKNACAAHVCSPLPAHQMSNAASRTSCTKTDYGKCDGTRGDHPRELIDKPLARRNGSSSTKKIAKLSTACQFEVHGDGYQNESRLSRPGVISENEVNRRRLPQKGTMRFCLRCCAETLTCMLSRCVG